MSNFSNGYNPTRGPSLGPSAVPTLSVPAQAASPLTSPGAVKKQQVVSSQIYDRNLNRSKHQISLSSLSFLFMQIIRLNLNNSNSLSTLERKLNNLGYSIGLKYLDLTSLRLNAINPSSSKSASLNQKRCISILEILNFLTTSLWPSLFDKKADSLEKSKDHANQFMIIDNDPCMSRFISLPKDYQSLNTEAIVAGIIEGALDTAYFSCEVSAHSVPLENYPQRTVYLIKFEPSVLVRENR